MQTFMPFENYQDTADILDNKRLNKQILEGYQILKILSGASPSGAWRNHPAVLMWKRSEHHLSNYIDTLVDEANHRNIRTEKNVSNLNMLREEFSDRWGSTTPFWVSDLDKLSRVTDSHKANLYRKDPIYYAEFQSNTANPCCDKCLYYWPTHIKQ